MSRVTVVDYGIGNLLSVQRACEFCGVEVEFTDSSSGIDNADHLILPGVGAFADGMAGLRERRLVDSIRNYAAQNRPFLGICLGMQMMLEVGEEFGKHEGLGLIPGQVIRMPAEGKDGKVHKTPYIGWAELVYAQPFLVWRNTILNSISPSESVYFVHSYVAKTQQKEHSLASYFYSGQEICAVIKSGNLYGCQFHPEKSGRVGLKIIRDFLKL